MTSIYQQIISKGKIETLDQLNEYFDKVISNEWVNTYFIDSRNLIGDITIQRFFNYTFIYDYTGNPVNKGIDACSIPDSRVVGVFGISNIEINKSNRSMMKKFLGKPGAYDCLGGKYDRGHFIAHLSGGPIDINLFPQRRDINRGWSIEGKKYREMERFIAANPGIFVFSRPLYGDFSCCPYEIEFGYCNKELIFTVENFPNKYSRAISSKKRKLI